MLVLRRKAGESIILNQVITIRILGVEGDKVKLGIDAPPDVIVVREEILGRDAIPDDERFRRLPLTPIVRSGWGNDE